MIRNTAVNCLDLVMSMLLAVIFLSVVGILPLFFLFRKEKKSHADGIIQLYISIIDIRESVISTQEKDMLLGGFIKKILCYHFDFDKVKDEQACFGRDIQLNIISMHPDGALTKALFRKTAACLVEIKSFFTMLKAVLKEKVNIIRAQDPHLLGFNAYLLSRLARVPFIAQICSNYEIKDRQAKGLAFRPFMFKGLERGFERALMRASDLVLTDREHYRDFGLIPKDIPDEKYGNMGFFVSEFHYASPASRKDLRAELEIPAQKKILLYVGRLSEVKYPLDLIDMLVVCLKKKTDLVLLIAGDGVLRKEMERRARKERIIDNILFLHKLPQVKLVDLYYTADVICFTSAGFTMVEAALAEKCIVAYDFEWHAEFIGANERGILVPFGDTRKFAEEVLRALEDPRLRNDMGRAARSYAIDNYSRQAAIEKEINFYKRVFDRRGYKIEKVV